MDPHDRPAMVFSSHISGRVQSSAFFFEPDSHIPLTRFSSLRLIGFHLAAPTVRKWARSAAIGRSSAYDSAGGCPLRDCPVRMAAKWTFRLDCLTGHVAQLVKTTEDDRIWQVSAAMDPSRLSSPAPVRGSGWIVEDA